MTVVKGTSFSIYFDFMEFSQAMCWNWSNACLDLFLDNGGHEPFIGRRPDQATFSQKDNIMLERLVDVLNERDTVLHTFPIKLEGVDPAMGDVEYEEKASKAAGYAQLVPDAEVGSLHTRMHVTRGGRLSPVGDVRGPLCETAAGLNQLVREHAYDLWQQAGSPEGRADEFWRRACSQNLRERAYHLWQQEGCPEGRADQNWHDTQAFEIG